MDRSFHAFSADGDDFVVNPRTMKFARLAQAGSSPSPEDRAAEIERLVGPSDSPVQRREPVWKLAPPDTMVLMLTYACDMACRYCCQGEIPDVRETEMSEEVARRAIDWIVARSGDAPEIGIGWFGGEPLMKFAVVRRLTAYAEERAAAAGKRVRFGTMTNGLSLTDEAIDFIVDKRLEVSVSLDGPAAVQDANRPLKNGAPSYDLVAPRVRKLAARHPSAEMRATLFPGTDIQAVLAEARALGFRRCRIEKVSSSMTPGGMKNDEAAATDEFLAHLAAQAGRLIETARARDPVGLAAIAIDSVFVEAVRQAAEANQAFLPAKRRWFGCGTGRQLLAAAIDGEIYPCPRFLARPEHRVGSIDDPVVRNEAHRKSLLFHADQCPACWARHYCGGACVVEHMGATGSMFEVNPDTCRLRKGKFEQAVRVVASLGGDDLRFLGDHGFIRRW